MKSRSLTLATFLSLVLTVPISAATYHVDSAHSSVSFMVKHMNASFAMGRFNAIGGTFVVDEVDPSASKFDITIKTESIDTANAQRDAHLKNADFFNAKQFPVIAFKSKTVKTGAEKGSFEVAGDLTLHGVTKPITVKITHTGTAKSPQGTIAGILSTFTIKRSDYGMKGMLGPIGDDVTITFSAEGGAK